VPEGKVKAMLSISTLAETAALVGDPARANMLTALMDGRALIAAELARGAGVTPQTASGHLARLTEAGLLAMERQGRHRNHRLASPLVAQMLEGIMAVAADLGGAGAARRTRPAVVGPRDQALRRARTCYNHLAGQVAVAMADRMVERGQVDLSPDGGALTDDGATFLRGLGVDLDAATARAARSGADGCSAARASTGASGARISPARSARRCARPASPRDGCAGSTAPAPCASPPSARSRWDGRSTCGWRDSCGRGGARR
jgi:DNA-binding transcriptional ArsR family regulator